jgi:hypothetical protein
MILRMGAIQKQALWKIDYVSQRAILLGRSVTAMLLVDVSNPCHYLTPIRQTSYCRHPIPVADQMPFSLHDHLN